MSSLSVYQGPHPSVRGASLESCHFPVHVTLSSHDVLHIQPTPLVQASHPLQYLESLKQTLAQLLGPSGVYIISLSSVSLGGFILYLTFTVSSHDMLDTCRTPSAIFQRHTLSISDVVFMGRGHPSQLPS